MAAYGKMESAILGLPYGEDFQVDSVVASGTIAPGRPVYEIPGAPGIGTQTYASGAVFMGVAMRSQVSYNDSVGTYPDKSVVNVLKKGKIWVQVAAAISTAPAKAYTNASGLFATSGYDVGAFFRTNQATVSGLAVVEVGGTTVIA